MRQPLQNHGEGYTLAEMLSAVAIAAVLATLLFAGGSAVVAHSKSARCVNNLRELGIATRLYTAENNGWLPFYHTSPAEGTEGKASYTTEGPWCWHLAPYVGVPRWDTVKIRLGPQGGLITRPNVFTCPSHSTLAFPTNLPVSYSPTTSLTKAMKPVSATETAINQGVRITDIPWPSKKAWLADSVIYYVLNVSPPYWVEREDGNSVAQISFTRHSGAGNVLFFDGHVERIPYDSIVNERLTKNLARLFSPLVEVY